MSSINEKLSSTINEFISTHPDSPIDKKELLQVINDVFSSHKKSKKTDSNGEPKPKRPPSAYNLFIKQTMEQLKENGMTAKEKMKRIAEMWKEHKESKLSDDAKKDSDNEDNDDEDDIAPPPTPPPKHNKPAKGPASTPAAKTGKKDKKKKSGDDTE